MTTPTDSPRLIVALDLGTWGSTFAFASPDRPDLVVLPYRWPDQAFAQLKTLTALLCSGDGKAVACGHSARAQLANFRSRKQARNYHLFQRFKLALHTDEEVDARTGPIINSRGRSFSAIDLIAQYLTWLKQQALKQVRANHTSLLDEKQILWCVSVPGIWTDRAKWWMRLAAQRAGLIDSDPADAARLCLAPEPEASALYCFRTCLGLDEFELPPGTRFMVLDAGGGTVDISAYEVAETGQLFELIKGAGGLFGSSRIDSAFESWLSQEGGPLGPQVYRQFHNEEPHGFVEFWEAWEEAKCSFTPERRDVDMSRVRLPVALYQLLEREHPQVLARLRTRQGGEAQHLLMDSTTMLEFFTPTLDAIGRLARRQLDALDDQPCDYLFLVGGFNESPLLYNRIFREFRGRVGEIVKAAEPIAAVVKGAVYFVQGKTRIGQRRSRRTYGIRVWEPFREGIDPEEMMAECPDEPGHWCNSRFHTFVQAGQAVQFNEPITYPVVPITPDATQMTVGIYASESPSVRYTRPTTWTPDVKRIGEVRIDLPPDTRSADQHVKVTMYFGLTEIAVEAEDIRGNKVSGTGLLHFDSGAP